MRALHAYAAAAALGLVVNLLVFGPGHLLGTSSYWDFPEADSGCYLVGYRYFLHEPWHWPIFDSRAMNVPYAKSIAMTDSVPLFAALNKLVATIVPPWGSFTARAYVGLWHGLVYALQACCGVACIRALGHKSWRAAALTALVCLSVPTFIYRYAHASLDAHFLTLAALALYLRSPSGDPGPRSLRFWQVAQLTVASMVNPYHLAMSLGIFVASLLRSRHLRTIVIWLSVAGASVAIGLWVAGFLSSETSTPMPGFESASTNMLSAFIPLRSVVFGDLQSIANVNAAPYQYEGYAYLGLGVLVLLLLFIPHARTVVGVVKKHPFLFAVALGAWLFALSNHVYFGSHRLLTLEVPHALLPITQKFRSPGRFVWLPTYVGIVFLLHWALGRFAVGWRVWVLPVVAALQIVDGGLGDWKFRRDRTRAAFQHDLDLDAWRELVARHDGVEVEPSYECGFGSMADESISRETHFVAAMNGVPINGVKSARPTRDCAAEGKRLETLEPRPRILYVLHPTFGETARRFERAGLSCVEFYAWRACSTLLPAMEGAARSGAVRPAAGAAELAVGQPLVFGGFTNVQYLGRDWHVATPDGRWSIGETPTVIFRLAGEPPPHLALRLEAKANLCGDRKAHDIDVVLADVALGTLHFDAQTNDLDVVRSLDIPDTAVLRAPRIVLELRPRDRRPLREAGCGDESHILTIFVRKLWFE